MAKPYSLRYIMSIVATLLLSFNLMAGDDEDEFAELMALLDAQTDLATKSKMNADFVPGMITILHGDQLQSLGVQTVNEALGLVPGIYTNVGNVGQPVTIVRGVGVALKSSNLKIMFNGVPANSAVTGSADAILHLPIFQVERIEIIRGPGSPLYGEFAFSGVVNIITRSNDKAVQVKVGKHHYRQVDAVYAAEQAGLKWSVNASAWKTNGTERLSGQDNFTIHDFGYAPGNIFDHDQGQLLVVNADYGDYQFKSRYVNSKRGGFYGDTAKGGSDYAPRKESVLNVHGNKKWKISDALSATFSLTWQQTKFVEAEFLGLPAGPRLQGPPPPVPNLVDRTRQTGADDSYQKFELAFDWLASDNHNLLVVLEGARFKVDDSFGFVTAGDEHFTLDESELRVQTNTERKLYSIVLQDQWRFNENLDITLGTRFDHYNDWGTSHSPRIAAVWRLSKQHMVKAQYSEAFRPPALEQSNPGVNSLLGRAMVGSITSENLSTTEMSYIYRQPTRNIKATVFKTDISDLIEFHLNPGDPPLFRNLGEITARGVELEWSENFSTSWEVLSNISYVKTTDKRDVDEEFTGAVNWLANLGISWNASEQISHHLLVKYVGEQEGAELPNLRVPHVQTFDAYSTIDYTLVYKHLFALEHLTVRATAKNLGNAHWTVQAYPTQWPEGLTKGGRMWSVDFSYEF